MLDGYKWRRTQQINDNISNAWMAARFIWDSNLQPLKDYMVDNEQQVQRPEDMEAIVRVLNAAYGGTVKRRGE